jgi:hypothetical protein
MATLTLNDAAIPSGVTPELPAETPAAIPPGGTFEAELAQVQRTPNPQPGPRPEPVDGHGRALGSVPDGAIDSYWIGEDSRGVRTAHDPARVSLYDVPPFRPDRGTAQPNGESVIFVNGINNTQAMAANSAQQLANKTGADVRLFYNAAQGGQAREAIRAGLDNIRQAETPAVNTLANSIYHSAVAGNDLHIVSTSHGSILTRNALNVAERRLLEHYGYRDLGPLPGLYHAVDREGYLAQVQANSRAEALTAQALDNIKIETYGAGTATWPVTGPRYLHWVNTHDPVVDMAGISFQGQAVRIDDNFNPGANAVIVRFTQGEAGAVESHYLEVYVPRRAATTDSFDQMYDANRPTDGSTINIVDLPGTRIPN